MNLKFYNLIGLIAFIPIWVFRGNLNYIEISLAIFFFFLLPFIFHFYFFGNLFIKKEKPNKFFLSYYLSLIIVFSIDHNLGLMGTINYIQNVKKSLAIVDFEVSNIEIIILFLILSIIIFLIIYFLEEKGVKILIVFLFTLIVTNALDFRKNVSSFPKITQNKFYKNSNNRQKKLVLIFDEMSGINSLESIHPSGSEFKKNAKNFFEKYGFAYYVNAKSVSAASDISIPTLLNFIQDNSEIQKYKDLRLKNKNPLTKKSKNYFTENEILNNKFFDNSDNKNIIVYQSLYLDFCKHHKVIKCHQFNPFDRNNKFVNGFKDNALSRILSAYTNSLSVVGKYLLRIGRQLKLADSYLDPIGEKATFPHLLNQIANGIKNDKADLYFAHYLVPHRPFFWDEKCNFDGIRESKGNFFQFRFNNMEDKVIQHNIERNCMIYFLDKFMKKINKTKFWKNLDIFIISDHGARLLSENDNFKSVMFAIKSEKVLPGMYDDKIISNSLFKKLMSN